MVSLRLPGSLCLCLVVVLPLLLLLHPALVSAELDPNDQSIFLEFYHATHGGFWLSEPNLADLCAPEDIHLVSCDETGTHIVKITLANNLLEGTIPTYISDLKSLKYLDLSHNALTGEIPTELQGMVLDALYLRENQFTCPLANYQTWAPANDFQLAMEPCNLCVPRYCNDGECTFDASAYTATCDCSQTDFDGEHCETQIDDCEPEPCQNGGVCTDGNRNYTCECSEAYVGHSCETEITCPELEHDFGVFPSIPAGVWSHGQCVSGYYGHPILECDRENDEATWNLTTFGLLCTPVVCPNTTIDHAFYLESLVGTNRLGECERGYYGAPMLACLQNGPDGEYSGDQLGTPCTTVNCKEVVIDHTLFPETLSGTNANGQCESGFYGAPIMACIQDGPNATFSETQLGTPCTAVYCSSTTIDHAVYSETFAGANGTGECEDGYYGTPILACVQDGPEAAFSETQLGTPCTAVYCEETTVHNVWFQRTQAGQTAHGVCPTTYLGSPTRSCEQDGPTASFSSNLTSGSCQIITCPQTTIGYAVYRETPVLKVTVGICAAGWTGNPVHTCLLVNNTGVWSTNSTGRRCIENCPSVILFDATFVSTPVGQSRQGLCVEGYSGFPVLRCIEDPDYDIGVWELEVEGSPCQLIEPESVQSGKIAGGILGTIACLFLLAIVVLYLAKKRSLGRGTNEVFIPLE